MPIEIILTLFLTLFAITWNPEELSTFENETSKYFWYELSSDAKRIKLSYLSQDGRFSKGILILRSEHCSLMKRPTASTKVM